MTKKRVNHAGKEIRKRIDVFALFAHICSLKGICLDLGSGCGCWQTPTLYNPHGIQRAESASWWKPATKDDPLTESGQGLGWSLLPLAATRKKWWLCCH